ncbi:MAG TPA: aminotransferase class V-fold PLP-dependent enzyme, partial [Solirubrobacteraceae bacterium]
MTDVGAFRAEFPVLERIAYLNAGTTGPVPERAARAAQEAVARAATAGRTGRPYFEAKLAQADEVRGRMAGLFRCDPAHVALTHSTTDGVNVVLNGLDLPAGSEVLTSDEEHPGVLGPLGAAVRRAGWRVRIAPFDALADAVRPETRLVACSHVSWVRGAVVDTAALRATGVPLLLDGAQGIGAIPLDMGALDCDWYAASGQKWLCGREGTGCLYVSERQLEDT